VHSPSLAIISVLAVLGAALALLRWWQVRRRPDPEHVRKALHATMSAVVLALPWLFSETGPVVVLAALAGAGMAALRGVRGLRDGAGRVLHDVGRQSVGELCFPAGVAALFALTGGGALRYGAPVLVLGLADPAAALAGRRFGQARFGAGDGAKTAEGSLAFFAVAVGVVFGALALAEADAPDHMLLAALFTGAWATLAEVVARRGWDNLLVPLTALTALDAALAMDAAALARQLTTVAGAGAVALSIALLYGRARMLDTRRGALHLAR
jgi:phytol kinase